jgi:hypothetical protein
MEQFKNRTTPFGEDVEVEPRVQLDRYGDADEEPVDEDMGMDS